MNSDPLHDAIMNLPLSLDGYPGYTLTEALAHKQGFRDARHAAAELVSAHPSAAPQGAQPVQPAKLPRHKFWGAGEPDCPQDLKAPNGELHTMRCKVCGDGWRKSIDICFAAASPADAAPVVPQEVRRDAARMDWLEQAYTDGALHKYRWAAFMTQVAAGGYRAAIDAAMNAGLTIPAKEQTNG